MPPSVHLVPPSDFDWTASDGPAATVREVVEAAASEDGAAPLDEAALLGLGHGLGASTLWLSDESGFAWRHDGALDLAVAPEARGQGAGAALAAAATAEAGALTAWSHGHHPGAAALAARFGFEPVRDLWVMRRPLDDLPPLPPAAHGADGVDVRTFRVGEDEDAVVAVNAEAFAHHPEQGALTRAGLEERMAQPWFDPGGLFLAARSADGEIVGFHWTKVHDEEPPYGEVYVVGVSPRAQGAGLGRRLTLTGLHHLAARGLAEVVLYVEADNAPAVAVYGRLGFTHAPQDTHVQYARS
jgi:mycothiol synthase